MKPATRDVAKARSEPRVGFIEFLRHAFFPVQATRGIRLINTTGSGHQINKPQNIVVYLPDRI
jgi:hypothetical protein